MIPVEFIGRARTIHAALVADNATAIAAIDRITVPLSQRCRLGQTPSPLAFERVAKAWRQHVPDAGRLGLKIRQGRMSLSVIETRAVTAGFRFEDWGHDRTEAAMALQRITVDVAATRFTCTAATVACVPLRALARRVQHGWDNTQEAIRADLVALADHRAAHPMQMGVFGVATDAGRWVGETAEIEEGGQPVEIWAVRTFICDGMVAGCDVEHLTGLCLSS